CVGLSRAWFISIVAALLVGASGYWSGIHILIFVIVVGEGVLTSNYKVKKKDDGSRGMNDSLLDEKDTSGSLSSGLAAKIKNINGKCLGKCAGGIPADAAETCIGYVAAVIKSDIAACFTADAADEADGECINSTQNYEGVQVLSHAKPMYSNNDRKLNSFVGLPDLLEARELKSSRNRVSSSSIQRNQQQHNKQQKL
ncbi:hypothetical protein Tco_1052977, partial [Tanacetum coccineum]